MTRKPGFDRLTGSDKRGMQAYAEDYKAFLDEAKTERDAVAGNGASWPRPRAFARGRATTSLKAGDKIYRINRE